MEETSLKNSSSSFIEENLLNWNSVQRDSIRDLGSLIANDVWQHDEHSTTGKLKRNVYVALEREPRECHGIFIVQSPNTDTYLVE